jgi:hypothetical protein
MPVVFAIEGPAWLLPDIEDRSRDAGHWAVLMDYLRRTEGEPSLLAVSAHLLMVARR